MGKRAIIAIMLALGTMYSAEATVPPTTYLGNGTPAYYDFNTNFPEVYYRMSTAMYLDKTSAVILKEKGPYVFIAVNTFVVSAADTSHPKIFKNNTHTFVFDRELGDLYSIEKSRDKPIEVRYVDPTGPEYQIRGAMEPAEAVYYIMTGKKFFGEKYFTQGFYDRL